MLLELYTSFDPAKEARKLTYKNCIQILHLVGPQIRLMTTRTLIQMSLQTLSSVKGKRTVVAVFLSILFWRGAFKVVNNDP